MSTLKTEADLRVDELILITRRLCELTREEIDCITHRRPRELEPLTEKKASLSAQYARLSQTLKKNPDLIKQAAPDLRAALKEATRAFHEALNDLTGRLSRVRQISEGLVRAIATDVASRRPQPVGYGKAAIAPTESSIPVHIAYNRLV